MANITAARNNIEQEEVQYKAAVSSATFTKIGGSINHINTYQNNVFEFGFLKGITSSGSPTYNQGFSVPVVISGIEPFIDACEIYKVALIHGTSGSGGTSEIDIEWAAHASGTWASIFSTTPKVTSAASSDTSWVTGLAAPTGVTTPVLSKTTFAVGDRLRAKIVTMQTGTPNEFILRFHYRPT